MAKNKDKNFEEALWESCNALRGSVDPAEYKHIVLSLIFLKFANDKFDERRTELINDGKEAYIEIVEFYISFFSIVDKFRSSFIKFVISKF